MFVDLHDRIDLSRHAADDIHVGVLRQGQEVREGWPDHPEGLLRAVREARVQHAGQGTRWRNMHASGGKQF